MKTASGIVALAATANAAYQGFNYGSTFNDGSVKSQADFEAEFAAAAGLDGTDGAFTSARLYTMIQGATANEPISAIPAAIKTKTSLLLGIWTSAGADIVANELAALKAAIEQYGEDFTSIVAGISVGSEDLYRITETAASNGEKNPGLQPDVLADYITQVREAISGTALEGSPIGHVDTWTVWANASNKAVIDAVDWVGMDAYPYFEKEHSNSIENAAQLFAEAVANTNGGTGGKELWITETGWPVSGDDIGDAVPSPENAKIFWDEVGCPMFGVTNVWWYTFQDSNPTTPNPSFGVIGSDVTTTPLYDLSCKNVTATKPTSSEASTKTTSLSTAVKPSGTGSSGSVDSGSGSNATVTSGNSSPTSSSGEGSGDGIDVVDSSDALAFGHSFGAGVLAIMAAVFVL